MGENLKNLKSVIPENSTGNLIFLQGMLTSNQQLERVDLGRVRRTPEYKSLIINLLKKNLELKLLSMQCTPTSFEWCVSSIEFGLLQLSNHHKHSFEVTLNVERSAAFEWYPERMELYVNRFVNSIKATNVQNFRTVFVFQECAYDGDELIGDDIEDMCQKLKRQNLTEWIDETGGQRLIVSNKDCDICGYGDEAL